MSTIINATTTNGVVIQPDNSGSLVLQTNNGTTALTIDTSQNITTTNKLAVASMPTGSIVQVVQGSVSGTAGTPYFSTTSATYSNTGLAATITPTSSSNKILVLVSANTWLSRIGSVDTGGGIGLSRGSTSLLQSSFAALYTTASALGTYSALNYLDSPATTSATTYNFTMAAYTNNGGTTAYLNYNFNSATTSTIILLEVKA